jgi:hypothetical protein
MSIDFVWFMNWISAEFILSILISPVRCTLRSMGKPTGLRHEDKNPARPSAAVKTSPKRNVLGGKIIFIANPRYFVHFFIRGGGASKPTNPPFFRHKINSRLIILQGELKFYGFPGIFYKKERGALLLKPQSGFSLGVCALRKLRGKAGGVAGAAAHPAA